MKTDELLKVAVHRLTGIVSDGTQVSANVARVLAEIVSSIEEARSPRRRASTEEATITDALASIPRKIQERTGKVYRVVAEGVEEDFFGSRKVFALLRREEDPADHRYHYRVGDFRIEFFLDEKTVWITRAYGRGPTSGSVDLEKYNGGRWKTAPEEPVDLAVKMVQNIEAGAK